MSNILVGIGLALTAIGLGVAIGFLIGTCINIAQEEWRRGYHTPAYIFSTIAVLMLGFSLMVIGVSVA